MNNSKHLTCKFRKKSDTLPCVHYIRPEKPKTPGFCSRQSEFHCIEALKRYLPVLTQSAAKQFCHCKFRYYLDYIKGIRLKPQYLPELMKAGKIWGDWLAAQYEKDPLSDTEILEPLVTKYDPANITKIKLNALITAFYELELPIITDDFLSPEYKVHIPIGQNQVVGYLDRAYTDHIVETKLSSRPQNYLNKSTITLQLGTYFLANKSWEYCVIEAVQFPQQRLSRDEDYEDLFIRVKKDIISRPAHYFLGYNRKENTWGKRFWRSEFDLDEIFRTYAAIFKDLRFTLDHDLWYKNELACFNPSPCSYLKIKETGVVSEQVYEFKNPEDDR